ncbi:hypothetical protein F3Y22_tig00111129pilonHSYRG00030 [Hibiscus syriacus]|uniref:Reverse transcriptase Ty1/copia-type domain-containing protein n=1 Tax=Hibiscus syriacus TaxID=106335 RepID=A0A6A2YYD2_HIBSY|nr:hypothetical protein F3Y22_tig00111129pilonHSYRG00030 [Hibiscus syriacus]
MDENILNATGSSVVVASNRLFSTKKINVTLDDHNYLIWHQQVFLTIKTFRLQKYIDSNVSWPTQYVTSEGIVSLNPEYELYEEQDGALDSWLLSTVSEEVLPNLIGLNTAAEIWSTLHRLYSGKTTSRFDMSYKNESSRPTQNNNNRGYSNVQANVSSYNSNSDNFTPHNFPYNSMYYASSPLITDPQGSIFHPYAFPFSVHHQVCPTPYNMPSFSSGHPSQSITSALSLIPPQAYIAIPETMDDNAWYYIAFTDAHCRYTWIYFLKQKSESDRRGEFGALQAYMKEQGIVYSTHSHKTVLPSSMLPHQEPELLSPTLSYHPSNPPSLTPSSSSHPFTSSPHDATPSQPSISSSSHPFTIATSHPSTSSSHDAGIFKSKVLLAEISPQEPASVYKALQHSDWCEAVHNEYTTLMKNGTWEFKPLPPTRKAVGCKWLFKVNNKPDGSIDIFKVRMVVKGYSKMVGRDFSETFSPFVRASTLRTVLNLAVMKNWPLRQIDINNAFLNGKLTEEIYMRQPPGFEQKSEDGKELVCCLRNTLYGLRQAPRAWFETLRKFLVESLGFIVSKADSYLFIGNSICSQVLLMVYIDDIVITGSQEIEVDVIVQAINKELSLKDLDESTPTPMVLSPKLKANDGWLFGDVHLYRSIMGANPTHHARIKTGDILTKPLPPAIFNDMSSHLGVKSWAEINDNSHENVEVAIQIIRKPREY